MLLGSGRAAENYAITVQIGQPHGRVVTPNDEQSAKRRRAVQAGQPGHRMQLQSTLGRVGPNDRILADDHIHASPVVAHQPGQILREEYDHATAELRLEKFGQFRVVALRETFDAIASEWGRQRIHHGNDQRRFAGRIGLGRNALRRRRKQCAHRHGRGHHVPHRRIGPHYRSQGLPIIHARRCRLHHLRRLLLESCPVPRPPAELPESRFHPCRCP